VLKKRPLTRDIGTLRDDRLFIVACDDTYAPKQYFDLFRLTRIQIHVVPTVDGTSAAAHVLTRLLSFDHEEDDELWLVVDVDHAMKGDHVANFMQALKRARDNSVNVALSNPCFELWLLLHHRPEGECSSLRDANDALTMLRDTLGTYNKTRLNPLYFPLDSVALASARARALDGPYQQQDVPRGATTRVYRLIESIVSAAHPNQLPSELRKLLP
jgi:RloB-like protein